MYDFQPLGKTSIRLLHIQPALRDDHISCILNQYDDHIPPYDALSYYWGDPKPTRKLYVNDSLVDIHETLWEFLDEFQRRAETRNWIWTDFLCLNQRDHTEMGHQVPRMGYIYSKAERTISWLGCNDSSWVSRPNGSYLPPRDLEQDLRLISEKVKTHRADFKIFSALPKDSRWRDFTNLLLQTEDASTSVLYPHIMNVLEAISDDAQFRYGAAQQGIINIFSMPYWTRVWITQEVALGKEGLLMFGGASLDFEDLLLAYNFYGHWSYQASGPSTIPLPVPMEARAAVHEKTISFKTIMRWAQNCEASKVEDRIYGLLGLLERCGHGTDRLPFILTEPVDYTRNWSEVFWEIILTCDPLIVLPVIDGSGYGGHFAGWMELLPKIGQSLSCSFIRKSLQYADNKRATPLCRNKARVALCVIDICRQAAMTNMSICLLDTLFPEACTPSWPTKLGARKLWSDPYSTRDLSPIHDLQLILGTLFIETADFQDMQEDDKYQAALIGLAMMRHGLREGVWNCVPYKSVEGSLGHNLELGLKCQIRMDSSKLPCSSLSNTSSTSSSQEFHKCQTFDRHLVIPRTGWRLSLTDMRCLWENMWIGVLHIKG